jgi:hypothetical protein
MKSNATSRGTSIASSALTGPIPAAILCSAPLDLGGGRPLAANRWVMEEFTRCSVCCRTPLVGEEITLMRRGRREAAVCDLCLERPRTSALGDVMRRERVRTAAGASSVHRAWPAPARGTAQPAGAR